MGLVRFDPSVLKRRPQVLDFCNSERAFPLAEWLYGRRAWSVSRSVQADHLSEWAGGQLKLGWLREPHFFMLILFFVLHLFITVVFLAREHGKSKCVGRNQPPPPKKKTPTPLSRRHHRYCRHGIQCQASEVTIEDNTIAGSQSRAAGLFV